ncbi:MAG: deoxyribose-phosphate aldolase [Monoglobales bacterium]
MSISNISSYIDHTLLKQNAIAEQIERLCHEAVQYGFASVCVNPYRVEQVYMLLKNTNVKVCTVIGFPLGATTTRTKCFEAVETAENGATEVDMVINVGAVKDGNWELVKKDIGEVVSAVSGRADVKVILETCLLTDDEKRRACIISKEAGAAFVKTSTGFSQSGATISDVSLMRSVVGDDMGVKASGGIGDYSTAIAMIKAGASRIGTSSGVAIAEQELVDK